MPSVSCHKVHPSVPFYCDPGGGVENCVFRVDKDEAFIISMYELCLLAEAFKKDFYIFFIEMELRPPKNLIILCENFLAQYRYYPADKSLLYYFAGD